MSSSPVGDRRGVRRALAVARELGAGAAEVDGRELRTALRSYIVPLIGDVRLMDLSPWHVCHLLVRMQDEGFAPGTGRRVLMVLSSMLWQAKRERLVCRNVAAHIEPPGRTVAAVSRRQRLRVRRPDQGGHSPAQRSALRQQRFGFGSTSGIYGRRGSWRSCC